VRSDARVIAQVLTRIRQARLPSLRTGNSCLNRARQRGWIIQVEGGCSFDRDHLGASDIGCQYGRRAAQHGLHPNQPERLVVRSEDRVVRCAVDVLDVLAVSQDEDTGRPMTTSCTGRSVLEKNASSSG